MPIQEDSVFRRLYKHAQTRLVFDPGVPKNRQLHAYKRYIELENEMLKRHHQQGHSGLEICQARAAMVDVVIENLFLAALDNYTLTQGPLPAKVALLALGGYGRRELNPHSDIDILFLYPDRIKNPNFETFQQVLAEEILYPLWDLGWKIGHASRNMTEAIQEAKEEIKSKNAFLETRIICGSKSLFSKMQKRFLDYCQRDNSKAYIQQRLVEEQQRHKKFGSTIYLQEPDIKNGVGGLRDYQNILWIANIKFGFRSFKEINQAKLLRRHLYNEMEAAYDFLLRTRTELHFQNRRPTDKLNLEQQPSIAQGLGYLQEDVFERIETFMKDYYTAARTIYNISEILKERLALSNDSDPRSTTTRSFLSWPLLSKKHIDGFILQDKVLIQEKKSVFTEEPLRLIRVFCLMQQYGTRLHADLKFRISRSLPLIDHSIVNHPSAAKSFCSILRNAGDVYPTLELMHELGVLGRYLPEFGQLTCQVQHEYYHRYTADQHVLRTIKQLDSVFLKKTDTDTRYEQALRKNEDPLLLYLILLLHDIGKAEGIKGHAVSGVRIAQPILNRIELNEEQQEQVLFVIRNHLEMTRIWQRFDLDDPETIRAFAECMDDSEKLRFLYVHTYCDARGTAPTLWNNHKEIMHRTLYERTLEQLENAEATEQKRKDKKARLHRTLLNKVLESADKEAVHAHFNKLPEHYFTNIPASEIELHLRMVNQFLVCSRETASIEALTPIINWRNDVDLNITVVNVVTWNRAGLFYKLAGALTLAGVNIVSTKAFSREDHISIDTFYVMDPEGGIVSDKDACARFEQQCTESLVYGKGLLNEIERLESTAKQEGKSIREKLQVPFPTKVDAYYEHSLNRTIVEVQAKDQLGLLYKIARQIYAARFDIIFARIATERGIAIDTFYIEKVNTLESTNDEELAELLKKLEQVLNE